MSLIYGKIALEKYGEGEVGRRGKFSNLQAGRIQR